MTLFPTQPNIPSPTTAARPVAVPAPGVSAPLGADDAKRARILADAIRARFAQTLVGQDNLRESLIVTLVAGGHILIESKVMRAGLGQDHGRPDARHLRIRLVQARAVHS